MAAEVCSPFQILTELIKVQLPPGLTQTVGDVVHSRLLQSQLHQSFVTTLRETEVSELSQMHSQGDEQRRQQKVFKSSFRDFDIARLVVNLKVFL